MTYALSHLLALIGTLPLALCATAQSGSIAHAEKGGTPWTIEYGYRSGHVFPTNRFLRGANLEHEPIRSFNCQSIRVGIRTRPTNAWIVNYGCPRFGLGAGVTRFNEPEELGTPITVFGFFNAPFKRWPHVSLDYDIGLGIAFNWKPFDPLSNPNNISIGAKESAYVGLGARLSFVLWRRLGFTTGLGLTHFSNGALKKPNYGLNSVSGSVGLNYDLVKGTSGTSPGTAPEPFMPSTDLDVSIFFGSQNVVFDSVHVDLVEKYEGVNYAAFGVQACLSRHFSFKSKIGIGLAMDHNGAHDAQVSVANGELEARSSPFKDKLRLSIFPSYELVVNKVSVLLQPAFYLYRVQVEDQTPVFYQRIGIKYHPRSWLFVGVNLRAYQYNISEFLEWNLGYHVTRRYGVARKKGAPVR